MHRFKLRFGIGFLLFFLVCIPSLSLGMQSNPASVRIHVEDGEGNPIAGAEVSALKIGMNGAWQELEHRAESDESGVAMLSELPTGRYLAVVVKAQGFAAWCSDNEFSPGEARRLTAHMKRPVTARISVQTMAGKPIVGAMISLLSITDGSGMNLAARYGSKTPFMTDLPNSDSSGVIELRGVPEGAKITLTILHPDWVQSKIENLVAVEGNIGTAYLKSGSHLRFRLIGDNGVELPETSQYTVVAMPNGNDFKTIPYVYHSFQASGDEIGLTVESVDHDSFEVRSHDLEYLVTPSIEMNDPRFNSVLHLEDGTPQTVDFLVRKKRVVHGRVVGDLRLLTEDCHISALAENICPNSHPKDTEVVSRHQFVLSDSSGIRKDGTFELKLPQGRAVIYFSLLKAKAIPTKLEVVVSADGEFRLPDVKLERKDVYKGRLVDQDGNGIANGVVRLLCGFNASDYVRTNADGGFEIESLGNAQTDDARPELGINHILAFDPKSARSGIVRIDGTKAADSESLVIRSETHASEWILERIEEHALEADKVDPAKSRQKYRENIAQMKKAYADGDIGKFIPDLSDGSWLHTDARSLGDLQGKFVLLDFWFIGCGPCEDDLPSVKLTRELFGGPNFEVVGVHCMAHSVESVSQYCDQAKITYPIVVDNAGSTLSRDVRPLGVFAFPSYILLDPEGKIAFNDILTLYPMSLRMFKVEMVYSQWLQTQLPDETGK